MPGIDAAMERFNAMDGNGTGAETAPGPAGGTPAPQRSANARTSTDRRDSQANAQPAVMDTAQNSVTSSTDTPAAAASSQAATASQTDNSTKPGSKSTVQSPQSKTADDSGPGTQDSGLATKSRYAKAQERLEKTWEAVNKRKGDLDAQAQQIEQQRQALERDKAQLEVVRRQAEQPQATPEQAVQAAQARRRDADALRMQAKRADDAGRFEEAQRLNKQADKAESLADDLAEYAEQLRKNPPVSMQQRQQQFEQARKQWTIEACNAFPDLGKNGSRLQQVVAQHLNALGKQDPQLLVHPSLIYHVARLADAQIKVADLEAVAARVPGLEKEAESLRARIKELEADTTPAANGSVNRLGEPAQDDYASLRQSAVEIGHGRW
jgi:hypothetical protein